MELTTPPNAAPAKDIHLLGLSENPILPEMTPKIWPNTAPRIQANMTPQIFDANAFNSLDSSSIGLLNRRIATIRVVIIMPTHPPMRADWRYE
jgi:hypothetical protein